MNISIKSLIGFNVKAIDGECGTISDFIFSPEDNTVRYLVIDPQKWNPLVEQLLITPISVYYINLQAKEINLSIDLKQLKASPNASEHPPVSRQYEAELFQHYGYGYYWMGTDIWGAGADPSTLKFGTDLSPSVGSSVADEVDSEDKHTNLRSLNEVTNYNAVASDGHSHLFQDFILNAKSWHLDYAVIAVDTGIVSSELTVIRDKCIAEFSWHKQQVELTLTTQQLKANPHFQKDTINSDAFVAMMAASPIKS
jgi:sporulation protein YlmC with PRC-barrel domain